LRGVGPHSTTCRSPRCGASRAFDAAVLDVNLAGDRIDPVADVLSGRNVPFVFVTGYTTGALPAVHAERPRLCKPFKMADLLDTVAGVVAPPSAAA
jgi:hypothetical protein